MQHSDLHSFYLLPTSISREDTQQPAQNPEQSELLNLLNSGQKLIFTPLTNPPIMLPDEESGALNPQWEGELSGGTHRAGDPPTGEDEHYPLPGRDGHFLTLTQGTTHDDEVKCMT